MENETFGEQKLSRVTRQSQREGTSWVFKREKEAIVKKLNVEVVFG